MAAFCFVPWQGNFPFRSGYVLNGMGELPPYPVRVACEALADPHLDGKELLSAMAAASGVFYNHTHELECFDYKAGPNKESEEDEKLFSYQVHGLATLV